MESRNSKVVTLFCLCKYRREVEKFMIAFILGTKEGKEIVSLVNKYTEDIIISTATAYGGELLKELKYKDLNNKPLNLEEMEKWLLKNKVNILVDASHPYASEVTKNAIMCAKKLDVLYVRYERLGALQNESGDDVIRVKDYEEVIYAIKNIDGNILNTSGGNNVEKFINIDFKYRIIHRILPSPKVLNKIVECGVKIKDIIALQGPITYELEKAFIKQYDIKAIITKDSGIEGGATEKFKAARESNAKIIIIERPKIKYDIEFNDEEKLVKFLIEGCK